MKDLIRKPTVIAIIAGTVVLLLVWWFAWMAPEASTLSSAQAAQASENLTLTSLQTRLSALKADAKVVKAASPFLNRFAKAIPPTLDQPDIVTELYKLAVKDHITLQSVTDDTTTAENGYTAIPISFTANGSETNVKLYLNGIYQLPRLITIQTLTVTGSGSATSNLNVNGSTKYILTVEATAYSTHVTPISASPTT